MKNYEKYIDDVIKAASEGAIAVNKNGVLCTCGAIPCSNCIFDGEEYQCDKKALEWLYEEYVETEVEEHMENQADVVR